jgi:hypothetical protein
MGLTHNPIPGVPVLEMLATGSRDFSAAWRGYVSQFTQPQLLKMAEQLHGARLFHSSQIAGFSSQKLRNPAPAVFVAFGYLNVAHARSVNFPASRIEDVKDIGLPPRLPETLRSAWEGRVPLCDIDSIALGPVGLFEAFVGLRALTNSPERVIPAEKQKDATEALGKHLRLRYASLGIDWLSELPVLRAQNACLEDVLMKHDVSPDRLLSNLPRIASVTGEDEDTLWAVIQESL